MNKIINKIKIILIIVALSHLAYAGQISFYVPQEHEKFTTIDSLYNYMDSLAGAFVRTENKLIRDRDKGIRTESLGIKEQYFQHQLKYKQCTSAQILNYCKLLRELITVKTHYFNELLSALVDDKRVKCFLLLKATRAELSQINDIIQRFDVQESELNKIIYETHTLEVED